MEVPGRVVTTVRCSAPAPAPPAPGVPVPVTSPIPGLFVKMGVGGLWTAAAEAPWPSAPTPTASNEEEEGDAGEVVDDGLAPPSPEPEPVDEVRMIPVGCFVSCSCGTAVTFTSSLEVGTGVVSVPPFAVPVPVPVPPVPPTPRLLPDVADVVDLSRGGGVGGGGLGDRGIAVLFSSVARFREIARAAAPLEKTKVARVLCDPPKRQHFHATFTSDRPLRHLIRLMQGIY